MEKYKEGENKLEGFISGMPDHVYHATEGFISSTSLSRFARSPGHYFYGAPIERTRNMVIGSAMHTAILEPEDFSSRYMILEGVTARTASAYKQAIKNRPEEFTLTQKEGDDILAARDSFGLNPLASDLLNTSIARELSGFFTHPVYGVKIRVRLDLLCGGAHSGYGADYKSTSDARERNFANSIQEYRYHVQAAIYMHAVEVITGEKLRGWKFPIQEKEAPNAVVVYTLDDTALEIGRKIYDHDIEQYARCLETGVFDTYPDLQGEQYITLPDWVLREHEGELGLY